MQGVILAGGEGTRLRPLTHTRPKPLVPIAGRACIDYVIGSLVSAGIDDIVVTTGYLSEQLVRSVGGGARQGAAVLYSFEDVPLGTAGAVRKVASFLQDTFVVASGDVLADVDLRRLLEFHRKRKALATLALTQVSDPTQFGIVGTDADGRILRFVEKPTKEQVFSNRINAGIYVLEPQVLEQIPPETKFDFAKQVFPALLAQGDALFGMPIEGLWMDIGRPADLLRANADMTARLAAQGNVLTHSPIAPATLSGACYVGHSVILGPCTLRATVVYDDVSIGSGAIVEDSLLLEGARVGADARVRNSILGEGVALKPGAVVDNAVIGDGVTITGEVRNAKVPSD